MEKYSHKEQLQNQHLGFGSTKQHSNTGETKQKQKKAVR